jgi:RND family efflux transporter MFP subunit
MSWLAGSSRWFLWTAATALVIASTVFLIHYVEPRRTWSSSSQNGKHEQSASTVSSSEDDPTPPSEPINVKVVHPIRGAMERITVQVGSIQAFETVSLYAKASGFLKKQNVDIGDRVKRGDVLAVVDVPELEKQLQHNAAAVKQAEARVKQMEAKIAIAKADLEASKAKEVEAHANAKSATAWVAYYSAKLRRFQELAQTSSIEEKLVDEAKKQYEASVETENAAKAAISTAKANILATSAKIDQAIADVAAAESEVKVAEADLGKTEVQLKFATIVAPFDGFITHRSLFPGDYVRSPTEGAGSLPLLTIQRTDRMRVIVQIPDREVPYADPGDPAFVEIDALPGEKIPAKVSRIAQAEDPQTRLMHVEIDLPNPKGNIRQGMYGRVTIILDKSSDQLSIPAGCLYGRSDQGKGTVFVVRDGHVHLTPVKLGIDNGLRIEVLQGLRAEDEVVFQPSHALSEGAEVIPTLVEEPATKSAAAER